MVQRHKHGRDGNVVPLNRWTGSPAGLRTGADFIFTAFILELLTNPSFLHLLPSLFILIVFKGGAETLLDGIHPGTVRPPLWDQ